MRTATGKPNKWLALLAVTAAFSYTFISRYMWSPLMQDVSAEFLLNATQGGLYMSAFFVGYIVTQVPGGVLADKVEPKYILIAGTLVGGAAAALMSLISSYTLGLFFRLLAGIASGVIMSSCAKVLSREFDTNDRGVALGILLAAPPLGITIASMSGPLLNDALGWRGTFAAVGLFSLAVVLLISLFVSGSTAEEASNKLTKPRFVEGFKVFLYNRNQMLLVVAGFMFMFTTTGFPTWASGFVAAAGFTKGQGTVIATTYSLAGVIGSVVSGMLAHRLKLTHKAFLIITLGLMAGLSVTMAFHWPFAVFVLFGIVYGFISYLPASHFTALAIELSSPQYTGTSVATQNLFFQTASVLQPAILGRGIDITGGYTVIWLIFAAAMLIGSLASMRCRIARAD